MNLHAETSKSKELHSLAGKATPGLLRLIMGILILGLSQTALSQIKLGEEYSTERERKYYDLSEIISYGKVVRGKLRQNGTDATTNTRYANEQDYFYFCGFSSLYLANSKAITLSPDGTADSLKETFSYEDAYPISFDGTPEYWHKAFGTKLFTKALSERCSRKATQYPPIEIPIFSNGDIVSFILLDRIKTSSKQKFAWTKTKKIKQETIKLLDGSVDMSTGKPISLDRINFDADHEQHYYGIDCKTSKLAALRYYKYNKKGAVLESVEVEDKDAKYMELIPNTLGEAIHKVTCAL
jgi:hypothetical protein